MARAWASRYGGAAISLNVSIKSSSPESKPLFENGLAAEAGLQFFAGSHHQIQVLPLYTIKFNTPESMPSLENGLAAEAGLHVLLMHTIKLHTPESQS